MKSYIYAHILPETGEILYIGMGQQERAWSIHKRSASHQKILENLQGLGYSPADYVSIIAQGLDDADARRGELALIRQLLPLLNQQGNGAANAGRGTDNRNSVLTEGKVRTMRSEHADGSLSIRAIGRRHGVAYTTARKVIERSAWSHIN